MRGGLRLCLSLTLALRFAFAGPARSWSANRPALQPVARRALLAGCSCGLCGLHPRLAEALVELQEPTTSLRQTYDVPRDGFRDQAFARGMASGMKQYEAAVAPTKAALFAALLGGLPTKGASVVELGMGSFPNARFYNDGTDRALDIVGVDPNDSMVSYALSAAEGAGLTRGGGSVRVNHGVGEALPFRDRSVDAVVCTLTLCSVPDVTRTLAEVCRVLRPGGRFLFLEHVISQTDPILAKQQRLATPLQVASADGCHLDRDTLRAVREAPFASVDARYFDLSGFYFLNPTVAGIAIS